MGMVQLRHGVLQWPILWRRTKHHNHWWHALTPRWPFALRLHPLPFTSAPIGLMPPSITSCLSSPSIPPWSNPSTQILMSLIPMLPSNWISLPVNVDKVCMSSTTACLASTVWSNQPWVVIVISSDAIYFGFEFYLPLDLDFVYLWKLQSCF